MQRNRNGKYLQAPFVKTATGLLHNWCYAVCSNVFIDALAYDSVVGADYRLISIKTIDFNL